MKEKNEKKDVEKIKDSKKQEIKNEKPKNEPEKKEKSKENKNINSKEYVEEMIKKRKKAIKIAIISVIVVIIIAILLTIFSIITAFNNKIIKGISINQIDVSGMTQEEAEKEIREKLKEKLSQKLEFKYNEYNKEITTEELEANYKIEEAVKAAYSEGRKNNLIGNNFEVIKRFFQKENISIEVSYNKEESDKLVASMANEIPGKVTDYTYCIEDEELIVTKGKPGLKLDEEKTKQEIDERITKISPDSKKGPITLTVSNVEPGKIDVEKLYEEIHKEPKDAYIQEEPFKIVVDEDGVDFAITMEEAKKIFEEEKEEYIIPLKITKAQKTVNDLGERAFPDQLSNFTTKYDASNVNRTTNLSIAIGKINGKVLMPGEIFSYNQTLGKRSVEAGYKEAAVYNNGKVENGLGGGICQISSTLYNAVVMANLEVTDRTNHMFKTSYANVSRDATVVYGSIDFKFKNTRKYPIKIVASLNSGIASISIYGLKEDPEYTVKITEAVTSTIPYTTETIQDPTLPAGQEVVVQRGSNGCRSVAYKEMYLNGSLVSKTLLSSDTYSAMKRIVKVGSATATAPAATTPVEPPAPEQQPQQDPVIPETQPTTPTTTGTEEQPDTGTPAPTTDQ